MVEVLREELHRVGKHTVSALASPRPSADPFFSDFSGARRRRTPRGWVGWGGWVGGWGKGEVASERFR